jgi:P-type E1-E2 ATPase
LCVAAIVSIIIGLI